jgi:hypothetical protein|tara:strand:+ start:299 stop:469 length:171 start_codon:yes stop_codon:yes gene_type:complete
LLRLLRTADLTGNPALRLTNTAHALTRNLTGLLTRANSFLLRTLTRGHCLLGRLLT